MMNELTTLVTVATVIAPITTALMQAIKPFINSKYTPLLAILLSIVLSVLWALVFGHINLAPIYAFSGILSGLASTGLYSLAKSDKNISKE